uniref:UNC93-like protein MFSD11 n=1 Tax=Caenorhabditis tropicalis TaxID=1561998 RepID=A0A1I7TYY4_9PELO
MLLFFAYMSQEFIQEPLIEAEHAKTGLINPHAGYHSFAILYLFFTISCLLITPIVELITAKWSMVLGFVAYVFFQVGFAYLNSVYLYTTSALLGVGASFLWVGQGKYLTENCTGKTIERNTALTWLIFKVSLLGGGIFLFFMFQNTTIADMVQTGEYKNFVYLFCAISSLGCLNTVFLPQSAHIPDKKEVTFFQTLEATFILMRQPPMLLLSIIFLYTGFSRSFWIAIYPTCIKFTSRLGGNTSKLLAISCIATGIGQILAGALFSVVGKRARLLGKDWICVIACVIHLSTFATICLFFPSDAPLHPTENIGFFEPSVYVAIASSGLLGFGDAVIQTQVYSYLCDGYSEESSHAFALFKFYSAISSTVAFFISKYFTLTGHLVLYGTFSVLSAITAVTAQKMYFHKKQHFLQEKDTTSSKPIKIQIQESGSTISSPVYSFNANVIKQEN